MMAPGTGGDLESTDAASEVPHPRPMRDTASDVVAHASIRVCVFFFFFSRIHADSARFAPMQFDLCRIGFNSCRTGLIQPQLGRIGHIGSYQPAAYTAETGRKWPKHAGNNRNRSKSALNMARKAQTCLLLSFFCESRHNNVFFKNNLIVKIYRKYK